MKKNKIVYIPADAEINLEAKPLDPPKTKYEKSREIFNQDKVKKVTKGKYGREE